MKKTILSGTVVAAVLAIAAFWYWSPYLTLQQMRDAAKAGDANALSEHVDYPLVRESLKTQFATVLAERTGTQPNGAGIVGMLGRAVMERVVDSMVRPETVMRIVQQGAAAPLPFPVAQPQPAPEAGSATPENARWTTEREGLNTFIVYAARPGAIPPAKGIGLVLQRSGFADWKLTALRLPAKTNP